jgi:hypothetical protein
MDNRLQDRYVVIKLDKMTTEQRKYLELFMLQQRIDVVQAVVIEQDWPEYTPTVDMLMGRILREGKEAPKFPPLSTVQSQCQRFATCTMGFGHLGPCREQGVIHMRTFTAKLVCPKCNGRGFIHTGGEEATVIGCDECKGLGEL